jgi:hypothetical protein
LKGCCWDVRVAGGTDWSHLSCMVLVDAPLEGRRLGGVIVRSVLPGIGPSEGSGTRGGVDVSAKSVAITGGPVPQTAGPAGALLSSSSCALASIAIIPFNVPGGDNPTSSADVLSCSPSNSRTLVCETDRITIRHIVLQIGPACQLSPWMRSLEESLPRDGRSHIPDD